MNRKNCLTYTQLSVDGIYGTPFKITDLGRVHTYYRNTTVHLSLFVSLSTESPIIVHEDTMDIFNSLGLKCHKMKTKWSLRGKIRFKMPKEHKESLIFLRDGNDYHMYTDDSGHFISLLAEDFIVRYSDRNKFYSVYGVSMRGLKTPPELIDFDNHRGLNNLFFETLN